MLGGHLLTMFVFLWASLVASKPVQFSKKIAIMDEKDKIVGYTSHTFVRDDEKAYPEPPVMPGKRPFLLYLHSSQPFFHPAVLQSPL